MRFDRRAVLFIAGLVLVIQSGYTSAQADAAAQQRIRETQELRISANRWMLSPVDFRSQQDPATPAERQARDLIWERLFGATAPLSVPGARAPELPIVDPAPAPEIPTDMPGGVWLIGKFQGYRTLLTGSNRTIYTEVDLVVQHLFGHPNLMEGAVIAVGRSGGTIVAPWSGAAFSYQLYPHKYDFEPNHTYLVGLTYVPQGNYYLANYDGTTPFCWDVTDGFTRPNSYQTQWRAAHGTSELNGLTLQAATQLLDKKFQ